MQKKKVPKRIISPGKVDNCKGETLVAKPIMLMNRTPSRVVDKPRRDAGPVKPAQTLQPRHLHIDSKLLQADRALRIVHAVLLGGRVRVHARPPWRGRRVLAASALAARAAVHAMRLDAHVDVRLAERLELREGA